MTQLDDNYRAFQTITEIDPWRLMLAETLKESLKKHCWQIILRRRH